MRFEKKDLRLVTMRQLQTKAGKTMYLVKLADKIAFDCQEFILARDHSVEGLEQGKDYNVILDVDGRYSSVTLQPVVGIK